MPLSGPEQAQLKALIIREGGLSAFSGQVSALYVADQQASALATLSPAITVTVQNWAVLSAFVAQSSNATLYSVMAAITAAAGSQDASKLGPLFVALYAAVKAHLGV